MKKHLSLIVVALGLLNAAPSQAQSARLTFQSQPGDYIGQGQNRDILYTPSNSPSFSAGVRRSLPSGPAELIFVLGSGQTTPFALLFFGTDQLGIPMQPGSYPDAQRADFAASGHPGLDVSFESRGCNTVMGNFTVHEFTYSPTLGIQSFSATFEQHCEGGQPALFGTFTYQAVPEPATLSLFALAAGLMIFRKRK